MESMDDFKKTAVVADESATTIKVHKFLLSKIGFNVIEVSSCGSLGSQLVSCVKNMLLEASRNKATSIDVILLPTVMSDSDGPQITLRLRRLGYKGLIIAVSSVSNEDEIDRFLDSGCDKYILKPLTTAKLHAALEGRTSNKPIKDLALCIERKDQCCNKDPNEIPTTNRATRFRKKCFKDKDILEIRILLLDESITCRNTIHAMLCDFGHTVIEANNGNVGLNLVKNSLTAESFGAVGCTYDVILVGNNLSLTSATDVVKQFRDVGFQGLIVGMVTPVAYDVDAREFAEFRSHGADGVLTKPLRINSFIDCIKDICFPERLRATLLPPVQESSHMTEEEDFHLAHALAKASAQKKHMRILLVDESAAMRRIHDRLLTQKGHTVVVTASGIEGLSAVKKAKIEAAYGHKEGLFDVVLISPLMAGMKGPQTITSMRLQGFKGVMMVTSGDATSEETVEMRKSGADCVVAKPLNIKGFKRALRDFVNFLTDPTKIKDSHIKKWAARSAKMASESMKSMGSYSECSTPTPSIPEGSEVCGQDDESSIRDEGGSHVSTSSHVPASFKLHPMPLKHCPPSPHRSDEVVFAFMQAAAERRILGREGDEARSTQHRLLEVTQRSHSQNHFVLGGHVALLDRRSSGSRVASRLTTAPSSSSSSSFFSAVSSSSSSSLFHLPTENHSSMFTEQRQASHNRFDEGRGRLQSSVHAGGDEDRGSLQGSAAVTSGRSTSNRCGRPHPASVARKEQRYSLDQLPTTSTSIRWQSLQHESDPTQTPYKSELTYAPHSSFVAVPPSLTRGSTRNAVAPVRRFSCDGDEDFTSRVAPQRRQTVEFGVASSYQVAAVNDVANVVAGSSYLAAAAAAAAATAAAATAAAYGSAITITAATTSSVTTSVTAVTATKPQFSDQCSTSNVNDDSAALLPPMTGALSPTLREASHSRADPRASNGRRRALTESAVSFFAPTEIPFPSEPARPLLPVLAVSRSTTAEPGSMVRAAIVGSGPVGSVEGTMTAVESIGRSKLTSKEVFEKELNELERQKYRRRTSM